MISYDELRLVLDDWNYWSRSLPAELIGHPRRLTQRIRQIATGREIVAITGTRRCGKTTILYQLVNDLLQAGEDSLSVLLVNLEDHRFTLHLGLPLLDRVLSFYREEIDPTGPKYLFLDEPQEIEGWERWVRGLYDRHPEIRIFVTGSSSKLMASELSTLLTGRNLTFVARPFSFAEYLSFHGIEAVIAPDPAAAYRENLGSRDVLAHHLNHYLELGGFPEALKSDSAIRRHTLLQQYFDDILAKDVVRRHRVRNQRLLRDLALVLMSNIANLMSLGKLARILGTSTSSIVTLANHLEEAYLVIPSRFFSFSTMESVAAQKPRKVYAIDTGMRNAVVSRATRDLGRLAENLVHGHLSSAGRETSYWRDRAEVDFVIGRVDPIPINVCFGDDIPPREIRSLQRFIDVFRSARSLLITRSTFGQQRIGTSECLLVPLWAYLLSDLPVQ